MPSSSSLSAPSRSDAGSEHLSLIPERVQYLADTAISVGSSAAFRVVCQNVGSTVYGIHSLSVGGSMWTQNESITNRAIYPHVHEMTAMQTVPLSEERWVSKLSLLDLS